MTADQQPESLRLLHRHASGAYGVVWRAQQPQLKREVAVKIIRPSMIGAGDAVQHARALARVNDVNVVTVYGVDRIADPENASATVDVAVMEWLDGPSLAERLKGGRFSSTEALAACQAVVDGLRAIQSAGLFHGDLHPGNVIHTANATKLVDISCFEGTTLAHLNSSDDAVLRAADLAGLKFVIRRILLHSDVDAAAFGSEIDLIGDAPTVAGVSTGLAVLRDRIASQQSVTRAGLPRRPARVVCQYGQIDVPGETAELMIEAAQDEHGFIGVRDAGSTYFVATNRKRLVDASHPRDRAYWKEAIDTAVELRWLKFTHYDPEEDLTLYVVTTQGYNVAPELEDAINRF